jgi:hypothetical protein
MLSLTFIATHYNVGLNKTQRWRKPWLPILEVNDQLFTVSLTMYFRVAWQDPRILSPPTDNPHIPIALSFLDHLWVPDIYFYNLKSTQTLNIISEFAGTL